MDFQTQVVYYVPGFLVQLLGLFIKGREVPVEDRVRVDLLPVESLLLIVLKAPAEEVLGHFGYLNVLWESQRQSFDVVDELVLGNALPRQTPVQHLN